MIPNTNIIENKEILDDRGWIITNEKMKTQITGIYAVGDIRRKFLRQISTSISDGAIASTVAERYLQERNDYENIINNVKEDTVLCFWNPEI